MSLLSTSGAFGKDVWLPTLWRQLENSLGQTFKFIDAKPEWRVEGRNIFGKGDAGDAVGFGMTSSGGDFPAGRDPVYDEFKIQLSRLSHTTEVDFDEWELLQSETAAAADVQAEKLTKAVMEMRRQIVRQMWMDGTAKLARTTDTAAALNFTMQSSDGTAGSASQIDRDRFNWIAANRILFDIVEAATGTPITNGSARTVTNVNTSTNVVTVDTAGGNIDPTATTVIIWNGSANTSGTFGSKEFPGILAAVANGNTYLNIDRTAAGKQYWQATVVTGSTAGTNELPTLERVLKVVNRMAANAADGMQPSANTHVACSNFGVQAAVMQYMAPGINYTTNLDSYDMAPKGFQVQGLPVLGMQWWAETHAPHNNLFFLNKDNFAFVKPKRTFANAGILDFVNGIWPQGNGVWLPKTGSAAGKWAASAQAILTGLLSLACPVPSTTGRLDDITELGV